MIVVSDTSPLRYLVLIGAVDVLPQLFGEVLVPPAVAAELAHPKSPQQVREWIDAQPQWVQLKAPRVIQALERLGPGEVEAISLALEVHADQLLIDDKAGKKRAQSLGLSAVGTLAILDLAGRRGLLDFRHALQALESGTNFRISRALRDQLLRDYSALDEGGPATAGDPSEL